MGNGNQRKLLGERLLEAGVITPDQLAQALALQKENGKLLGVILLESGAIDQEEMFLSLLARHLNREYVRLREIVISDETIGRIPAQFASHYHVIPLEARDGVLSLATPNPDDQTMEEGLQLVWSGKMRFVLALESEVSEAIRRYYGVGAETIDAMMGQRAASSGEPAGAEDLVELDSEASIGKFLNQILLEAWRQRATDIHIEPFETELKIRYRVDGSLVDVEVPRNIFHFRDAIISRIKIMSNLNIAERRLPQDGRFKVRIQGVDLDLRVSFLPTPNGESVVIRLLSSGRLYALEDLGLSAGHRSLLAKSIQRPHGIVFVTGPTGSGKTTTLYCCLSRVMETDKKIITIEDPVEYLMRGVTQLQVNPRIGWTFAAGLRSMLRHDPDIMMVGEVRDLETAQIAIQVALTGHLVFSTLHTNDAAGGITRLLDMGVEPYLVASAVEVFIAQRLVRRICERCVREVRMTAGSLRSMGFDVHQDAVVREGEGCEACGGSGYHGRQGIFEFLPVDDETGRMITRKEPASEIRDYARSQGMRSLMQDGWDKIQQGVTTVSEVVRVTRDDGVVNG